METKKNLAIETYIELVKSDSSKAFEQFNHDPDSIINLFNTSTQFIELTKVNPLLALSICNYEKTKFMN